MLRACRRTASTAPVALRAALRAAPPRVRFYAQEYVINRVVRVPKQRMYDTIGDVERYPEFVPYCTGCDVHAPEAGLGGRRVYLKIKWKQFEDGFESIMSKSEDEIHSWAVNSEMFTELRCLWSVHALTETQCNVQLKLVYQFQNPLYNMVSQGAGRLVSRAMIAAFLGRAVKLHTGY